ncbi:MAG: thiamine biosynthesis protein [Desulfobulbaceae bacterium]|nr:thiamine biosynthesis protein [Desulfobulbaceae bacterium]
MGSEKLIALALFSGGLDSILACRVIMAQGIAVKAVRFVTPFFGYELLAVAEQYRRDIYARYGIEVMLRDLSEPYVKMLGKPVYGYGKNFNPCLDCKILIAATARAMLPELGASFLISGEVIGQRPMSQRLDTLRVVERDSDCEGLLLRPLCAAKLKETIPEQKGWVERRRLPLITGRGRAPQIELAASMGINDYPTPGGGCMLTDINRAGRIRRYYSEHPEVRTVDIHLLLLGRQFILPGGGWLVLGRDERENVTLAALRQPGDLLMQMEDWPGPVAILRNLTLPSDLELAAGLIHHFSRKGEGRQQGWVAELGEDGVSIIGKIPSRREVSEDEYLPWQR